jgi:hypothetical protein
MPKVEMHSSLYISLLFSGVFTVEDDFVSRDIKVGCNSATQHDEGEDIAMGIGSTMLTDDSLVSQRRNL